MPNSMLSVFFSDAESMILAVFIVEQLNLFAYNRRRNAVSSAIEALLQVGVLLFEKPFPLFNICPILSFCALYSRI